MYLTATLLCIAFKIAARETVSSNCAEGALRLVNINGSMGSPLEGRLEVCINRAWGTVCLEEFTRDEARIVCSTLGFDQGNWC